MDKQTELNVFLKDLSDSFEAEKLATTKLNDAIRFKDWAFVATFAKELERIVENREMIEIRIAQIRAEIEKETNSVNY